MDGMAPPAATPKTRAITYRIFLPDGSSEGLRIVEKAQWTGIGLMASRTRYLAARQSRGEFARPGVYILLTPGADGPSVYVGEADSLVQRLDEHVRTREDWTQVVVFTSKDGSLNKAHAKNLESRLVGLANVAKRVKVENRNVPPAPQLHEAEQAEVEAFLEEVLVILPLLGIRSFDVVEASVGIRPEAPTERPLQFRVKSTNGRAIERTDEFVVLPGSTANKTSSKNLSPSSTALRVRLVSDGTFVDRGDHFEVSKQFIANSPSQGAEALLGYPVSGLQTWRTESGKTMKQEQEGVVSK